MMEITIGSTYHDRQMNQVHVLDIAENFNRKSGENSKVVLYRKNKSKKVVGKKEKFTNLLFCCYFVFIM